MRKIVVVFVVALLSLGGMAATAPSASACADLEGAQCVVNCVRTVVEDGLQARCRL